MTAAPPSAARRPGRASRNGRPLPGITVRLTAVWWCLCVSVQGGSLHEKVDAAMDAVRVGPEVPAAEDPEFLRRAWLTLTGAPPPAEEARAFLADTSPDKRAKLIASLTAGPAFVRHLAVQVDVMLMERRAEMHSKAADWRKWLEESLAAGKPWNQLVSEILAADGSDEKSRHIARWLLERQGEAHLLTRDAGRLFLGRDMACAQCHDHPRIDDYAQRDYHGLLAFFGRTALFQPVPEKPALISEQADGETAWISVFTKISGASRPRLPGQGEIAEPAIAEAEKWQVAPVAADKNVRPVPKYSRRARLAETMTASAAFRENIANRMWGLVMGRCLVEPPDLIHSGNAAAHPAVLKLLGDGMAAEGFDLRTFVRELALTKTFAQAFDPAPLPVPAREALIAKLPALEEEAARLKEESSRLALAFSESAEKLEEVHAEAEPVAAEWKKAAAAHGEVLKAVQAAEAEVQKAVEKQRALSETAKVLRAAAEAGTAASLAAPADKEIEAAAKTFQTRLTKTAAEEGAAGKEITDRKAAAAAKTAEAEMARQAAEAKKPAAEAATARMAAAQQVWIQADAAKQPARIAAQQAAQRLTEAKALLACAAAAHTATPLLQEAERLRKERRAIEEETVAKQAAAGAAEGELAVLEKQHADRTAASTKAQEELQSAGGRLEALSAAAAKSKEAAKQLSMDAEVITAAKTFEDRAAEAARVQEAARQTAAQAGAAAQETAGMIAAKKEAVAALKKPLGELEAKLAAAKTAEAAAAASAAPAEALLADAQQALAALESRTFAVATLAPLPPEQFCWSVLKVTGALELERQNAAREWDEKNKPSDADKADPAKQTARAAAIETMVREKTKPHEDQFVRLFGNSAGQPQSDFFATADQVLYFENAGALRSWTNPAGNNLSARLTKIEDPKALAEELYLSVLTRLPSEEEAKDVASVLAAHPADKKAAAVSDAVWALVTATEFRFRH